ncbi:MAG: response regulator [Desulfobacteraceae bacterium]|nr:response regulator [Desulfobacteraceae bacterium]
MVDKDAAFLQRLLATFRVEAEEHLQNISTGLDGLKRAASAAELADIVEVVFREAHSLKGAARSVNLADIESLCQAMEGVFAAMKRHELEFGAELFELLQQASDYLGRFLPTAEGRLGAGDKALLDELVVQLEGVTRHESFGLGVPNTKTAPGSDSRPAAADPREVPAHRTPLGDELPPASEPQASLPVMAETVRVSTARLHSLLLQSEELLFAKSAAAERVAHLQEVVSSFQAWEKEWARILPAVRQIRTASHETPSGEREVSPSKVSGAMLDVSGFLAWNREFIKTLGNRHVTEIKAAAHDSRTVDGMVNSLLADMKKVLMFPFSTLLEILPKIVRELSRDNGKEADLAVSGEGIEIDRRILEELKDPLVHLIRNCIDHGIEKPEQRIVKAKPRRGLISVDVIPGDNRVEVVITDDGAGIALERVRAAVLKLGTHSREKVAELSDRELLPFVFQSGVTTSPIITEISGRGLGLAIVREKVEKLGGTISLESRSDAGVRFRMVLPLTLATFHGVLVRVGEDVFVIPTMHVERTVRLKRTGIKTVENRETVQLKGEAVSLARLADVLRLSPSQPVAAPSELIQVVLLNAAGTRIAFLVDEVLNEQEVLLKKLGRQLSRVRNVAGATITGNGRVIPVLSVPDLLKSAVKFSAASSPAAGASEKVQAIVERRSVLVAEDSITTRTLLQNILGTAGYDVVTAVDGLDAFSKLKSREFDIVVSDVEMPRMNGFELTTRIRADKHFADLPVVLVTALESREDRERGIDAGASAYIVKKDFDQSNLLDMIKRLV